MQTNDSPQLLRDDVSAPTPATYQPQGDSPVMPRSQVRTLTDNGIVNDEQVATPLFEEGGSEAPAEQQTDATTSALQALLDQHDASSSDTSEGESAGTPEAADPNAQTSDPNAIDYESPKVKALAEQFQNELGIDLKSAIENYQRMTQIVEQQAQQQAQQEYRTAAQSLMEGWGVNDAEFNRRVSAVLDYANTLPPDLAKQFDSVQGIQLLWTQIEKRSANAPTARSSGDAQRSTNPTGAKTFRKSELMTMMATNPQAYNAMQAEIMRAYETGNVIDDV